MFRPDERFIEEGQRLGHALIALEDEDVDIGEFVREHASPEYLAYYERVQAELDDAYAHGDLI